MDFFPAIVQIIGDFWYLFLLPVLLFFLKTLLFRGWFGVSIVNPLAWRRLDKDEYYRFNDVVLTSENGTVQIDHIILSIYGVFVVETINMKGRILGDPEKRNWTQKIFTYTNTFQNPLLESRTHVNALQSFLGLKDNQIYPVIAFVGASSFKNDMPENVTHGMDFIRYIKSGKQQVLSETDIMEIKIKIIDAMLDQSYEANRRHVNNTGNTVRKKESKGSQPARNAEETYC